MKDKTYEEAFRELEELVKKLEDENTNIDEAIIYFQKAIELKKYCQSILDSANEKVVKILSEENSEEVFESE